MNEWKPIIIGDGGSAIIGGDGGFADPYNGDIGTESI